MSEQVDNKRKDDPQEQTEQSTNWEKCKFCQSTNISRSQENHSDGPRLYYECRDCDQDWYIKITTELEMHYMIGEDILCRSEDPHWQGSRYKDFGTLDANAIYDLSDIAGMIEMPDKWSMIDITAALTEYYNHLEDCHVSVDAPVNPVEDVKPVVYTVHLLVGDLELSWCDTPVTTPDSYFTSNINQELADFQVWCSNCVIEKLRSMEGL